MANPFTNQPRYSKDMCQAMRDVNELEDIPSGASKFAHDFCITGTRLFVIFTDSSSVFEFSTVDGSYVTTFATASAKAECIAIDTDGTYLYIADYATSTTYQVEKYTLAGSLNTSWSTYAPTGLPSAWDGSALPFPEIRDLAHYDGALYLTLTNAVVQFPWSEAVIKQTLTGGTTWAYPYPTSNIGDIYGVVVGDDSGTDYIWVSGTREPLKLIYRHLASDGSYDTIRELGAESHVSWMGLSTNYAWKASPNDTPANSILYRIDKDVWTSTATYTAYQYGALFCVGTAVWCSVKEETPPYAPTIKRFNEAGVVQQSITLTTGRMPQTEFMAYTSPTTGVTLGTPDAGVSIPGLEALSPSDKNAIVADQHLIDVRNRVEALAPYYTNVITGNPFNWTVSSPDNLLNVALVNYDWLNANDDLAGASTYDWDMHEVRECLDKLLDSTPV